MPSNRSFPLQNRLECSCRIGCLENAELTWGCNSTARDMSISGHTMVLGNLWGLVHRQQIRYARLAGLPDAGSHGGNDARQIERAIVPFNAGNGSGEVHFRCEHDRMSNLRLLFIRFVQTRYSAYVFYIKKWLQVKPYLNSMAGQEPTPAITFCSAEPSGSGKCLKFGEKHCMMTYKMIAKTLRETNAFFRLRRL